MVQISLTAKGFVSYSGCRISVDSPENGLNQGDIDERNIHPVASYCTLTVWKLTTPTPLKA